MKDYFQEGSLARARDNVGLFVLDQALSTKERLGFGWVPAPDAPSTYKALCTEFRRCRDTVPLRVSSEHSDNTIFGSAQVNYAFRFWHDVTHVTLRCGFSQEHETVVAHDHLASLEAMGYSPNSLEYYLLHADTVGQNYCAFSLGRFPRNQARFVWWCLNVGVTEAIAYEAASG